MLRGESKEEKNVRDVSYCNLGEMAIRAFEDLNETLRLNRMGEVVELEMTDDRRAMLLEVYWGTLIHQFLTDEQTRCEISFV